MALLSTLATTQISKCPTIICLTQDSKATSEFNAAIVWQVVRVGINFWDCGPRVRGVPTLGCAV